MLAPDFTTASVVHGNGAKEVRRSVRAKQEIVITSVRIGALL
jgi:hypothetical protein